MNAAVKPPRLILLLMFRSLSWTPIAASFSASWAYPKRQRGPSHRLTYEEAVSVHLRLMSGEMYSRIAASFDVNQGRIADVKFGRIHPGSYDEALRRSKAA
jgi:hypothetical protein